MSTRKKASTRLKQNTKYTCEVCHHEVDLQLTAKVMNSPNTIAENKTTPLRTKPVLPTTENVEPNKSPLPVLVTVQHDGFWITDKSGAHVTTSDVKCDRNSIMLKNTSLLYVYKLALRHLLLSRKLVTVSNIDAANLVSHVKIRKDANDKFSKHESIQGQSFIIDEKSLSAKNDFLIIELSEEADLHFTMIYSKKIKSRVDLVGVFKEMITMLDKHPELIQEYSNLPYFGEAATEYWYENGDKYPFNVTPPADYIGKKLNDKLSLDDYKISPAGVILRNLRFL